MANVRRPKSKPKYTHTGVRINYNGNNRVVFLRKTSKRWKDQSGTWFNAQGQQMGLNSYYPPTCELDLTTIRPIEDR
ncbi:hypothetical protein OMDBNIEC_00016 [Salmonella phage STP-SP5]|nr:hypothetical protein OMDBNIEC_00016 [Salmonella phage STP-SP5]